MLSIVVPTLNEAANLPVLAVALSEALGGYEYELIIADDHSTDDTDNVVAELQNQHPIKLIKPGSRPRDLSLSVLDGIGAATFDSILVMDADLSHPPEVIPQMLEKLHDHPTSFILGSRYVAGGSFDREWSVWRFVNSYTATLIAKPLTNTTDPMSGFFLFRRSNVPLDALNPIGYKIGLELMVRGQFASVIELPILFKDRTIGESKMNLTQQVKYLRHLRRLYVHRFGSFAEFINFGLVGASGFLVDLTFYLSLQWLGLNHLSARAISFWPAVSWNWALNRLTTFGEREKRPKARQWVEFVGTSLIGFGLNMGTYTYLTTQIEFFLSYKILAMIVGIASASLFNFAASSLFVYSDKRKSGG